MDNLAVGSAIVSTGCYTPAPRVLESEKNRLVRVAYRGSGHPSAY